MSYAIGSGRPQALTATLRGATLIMANAGQFYDGPALALAPGTWLVGGGVSFSGGIGAYQIVIGTPANHYVNVLWTPPGAAQGFVALAPLRLVLPLGATITLSAMQATTAGAEMIAGNTPLAQDVNIATWLTAEQCS